MGRTASDFHVNEPTPLRAVFSAPPGPDGSQTSTAAHCFARLLVIVREVALPSSSSDTSSTFTGRGKPPAVSSSDRESEHHLRDAGLHVEYARPGEPAFFFAPWHCLQRAQVVDGVEVSQQQNRRAVSRPGKIHFQVIAGVLAGDELSPSRPGFRTWRRDEHTRRHRPACRGWGIRATPSRADRRDHVGCRACAATP